MLQIRRKPYKLYSETDDDMNFKGYFFVKKNPENSVFRPTKKEALEELRFAKRWKL